MERNFILHLKTGNKLFSEKEVIENALEQERNGVEPHYSLYDHNKKSRITNPGWLVWSTNMDGCGVVYRRNDGKMIVMTGWQGDFCYC